MKNSADSFQNHRKFFRAAVSLGTCLLGFTSCAIKHGAEHGSTERTAGAVEAQGRAYEGGSEHLESALEAVSRGSQMTAVAENLDEIGAVRQALSRGLDVGLAELALSGSEFERDLAKSALLPRLVGSVDLGDGSESLPANTSRTDTDDLGASLFLRQDLLTWGANRKRLEAAGFLSDGQAALLEMQKIDTAASIHLGFENLRRIDRSAKAYRTSITAFNSFLTTVKDRKQAGLDSGRAVEEVKSRVAELEARLAMLDVESQETKAILDRLIGTNGEGNFKLYPAVVHTIPKAGVESLDLGNRPDVAALEQQLKAAELELGATKAERWPKISIAGGVRSESDYDLDNGRSDLIASAGARWTPIDGGALRARTQLAQNQIDVARLKLGNAQRIAEAEVRAGIAAAKRAGAAYSASKRALTLTQKSLELTKAQQLAQRSEIDHVLNIQSRVLRASLQAVNSEFALHRQEVLVKRALGTMTNGGVSRSAK